MRPRSEIAKTSGLRSQVAPPILLGLAFFFLTRDLARASLWVDELFSVQIAGARDIGGVVAGVIAHERRPPLYHLLLHGWLLLTGDSEFALRLLSVFAGLLAIAVTVRLGREVSVGRGALTGGLLLAISPAFVLYARMARYYSLLALLAALATLFFVRWVRRCVSTDRHAGLGAGGWAGARRHGPLAAYFVTALTLAYSDYGAVAVLAVHTAYLAFKLLRTTGHGRSQSAGHISASSRFVPRHIVLWLATQIALILAFLPWLAIAYSQPRGALIPADLSASPLGWVLKVAYPVYAFTVGETLFPWNPLAWAAAGIALAAAWRGLKRLRQPGALLLGLAFVPILASTVLTSVAADLSFVTIPSRAFYALPFLALLVSQGLVESRLTFAAGGSGRVRLMPLLLLCAAYLVGLVNLAAGREYLNPIYNLPARQIAARIGGALRSDDLVIADWDSAVPYYCRRGGYPAPLIETPPAEAALARLRAAAHPAGRVWLVMLGRDRTRSLVDSAPELTTWLETHYPISTRWGYAEQDRIYRALKEMLLGRQVYRYRATVTLYSQP